MAWNNVLIAAQEKRKQETSSVNFQTKNDFNICYYNDSPGDGFLPPFSLLVRGLEYEIASLSEACF